MNNGILWYASPADRWEAALPLGNGILGMMVYGGVAEERLQLNEITLWSGYPFENDSPETAERLAEMRTLVFDGRIKEAQTLCEKYLRCLGEGGKGKEGAYGSYQTAGELVLRQPGLTDGLPDNYRRELDMRSGSALTRAGKLCRTHFVSVKGNVCVTRITGCDTEVSFERENCVVRREGDYIFVTGALPLRFATVVRTVAENSSTVIYSSTVTDYKSDADPLDAARGYVDGAADVGFDALFAENKAYFAEVLGRCELELYAGSDALEDVPTDRRIAAPSGDLGLIEKYFMFGRYLLVSSSRGKLPANLQGVWCKDYVAPWSADYHININIQMNYWFADLCGLSEFAAPFYDYVEGFTKPGTVTARVAYNCGGWVAHTITNPWDYTALGDFPSWGSFMCAGAWCCRHYFEHYLFTRDLEFLRKYYPVIRGSAEFFLDFLVRDPNTGRFVTCPSNSPENWFIDPVSGGKAYICAGPTMDNSILRELFTITAESARLLGIDSDLAEKALDMRDKLPPLRVGKYGQIMEWQQDYNESDPGHRHISSLYGLYPAAEITADRPELFAAARATIDRRLANGGGHTGWSRAWIICFFARLLDGNEAAKNIEALLEKSTLPNMFDNHPPFQIDGNFGGTAGIAEMLLQSHGGLISVLPALPDAWKNGRFAGLRARGGWSVDAEWRDGRVVSCSVRAVCASPVPMKLSINGSLYDADDGFVYR